MADMINHPQHYADKKIEVIDYIQDTLTPEGYVDYCLGNVLKYVSRWRKKAGVEDLKKAQVYLGWAIEQAEKNVQPVSSERTYVYGKNARVSLEDLAEKQKEEINNG